MIKKNKRIIFIMTLIAFIWVNNTSIFIKNENTMPKLLAHRGLAQTFDISKV